MPDARGDSVAIGVLYLAPPSIPGGLHWSPGTIYFAGSPAKLLHGIHMEFT